MPDLSEFLAAGLVLLLVVVMLGFALGTGRNVSRGNELLRWLQTGLPLVGRRTTLRWLGSSVVELHIGEPSDPFRDATVLAVLEPRDLMWLWPIARHRGRRDFLIVRADLRRAPSFDLEAGDRRGWTGRDGSPPEEEGWQTLDRWAPDVDVAAWGQPDVAELRAHWQRLGRSSEGVWRLSIRRTVPHLQVHFRPPDLDRVSSEQVLREIRDLALGIASR